MRGMIVAPQPEAVEAGAMILKRGGNAVDAAIACAFTQGVVDPQMSGIGGFGSMQVYMPRRGIHEMLEFYCKAPLNVKSDMWADKVVGESRDGFAFLLDNHESEIGYLSIGTPGSLKGYTEALASYGTMDLKDVMAPAIQQAHEGFRVRPHVHYYWTLDQSAESQIGVEEKLRFTEYGRRVYFHPNGRLKSLGEHVDNPDLARTLERIAQEGPDIFYHGEMAEEIVADMEANGGLLTLEDLRSYEVNRVDPLWGSYRGHRISTSQPPASGLAMLEFLHIMENFDVPALVHNSAEHIRILAEAMKRMTIDKDNFIGDPLYVDVPIDRLTAKDYARDLADQIKRGERAHVVRIGASAKESKETTTVVAVDEEGNAVALTHTIASPSGVITPGLGFMWNGCMSRFDPRPGHARSLAPGKRRGSSQAPTIVFEGDNPMTVMSAPGGGYIAPSIAQAIMNIIDFKMPIFNAVAAPRVMAISDIIDLSNRVPRWVANELQEMGYATKHSFQSYAFAGLHGIHLAGGRWSGAADPQRDGMALEV
jgi:gamma-glutamyltranspeptidase/glutathione hydrolase